jgi:hypothetical protein
MRFLIIALFVVLILIIAIWLTTVIIFYAWNLALTPLFHIPAVSWMQAFLIGMVLSLIGDLFKPTIK